MIEIHSVCVYIYIYLRICIFIYIYTHFLLLQKQRAKVPKFGDWQNENYTVCFEVARKNKGTGIMINPNDPQQNPDMFPYMDPSLLPPPSKSKTKPEEPIRRGAVRPIPEHRATSRNDADFRQLSSSTARSENTGQRTTNESGYDGRGQKPTGRPVRPSAGSGQSFDRTPVHHQAKITPGRGDERPRQRPVRGDETVRFFEFLYKFIY